MLLIEYIKIIIFFLTTFLIVLLLVNLPRILNKKFVLYNTFRPVECGSQSMGSGKNKIEIIFYRVLIIFIIFEIEVLIMVP
jgi:NADH:ubiquinone oxidoreductase subunit 3 (subunit A)